MKKSRGIIMNDKYKSEFMGSLHETAVGLNKIGVIDDKEMQEYDRDCLAMEPKTVRDADNIVKTDQLGHVTA